MSRGQLVVALAAGLAIAGPAIAVRIAWQDLSPLPIGIAGGSSGLLGGGKIVYAGGTTWVDGVKQWLRAVHIYDPVTRSWTAGPELPEPLAYGGRVVTTDGLEVLGGFNASGPSRNCWRLDARATRWSKSGLLPQDAALSRVERVGKVDYLFGGCSDIAVPMHCSNSIWKRDNGGSWTRAGEMPDGAVALRASAVVDGRVYLFGGCSEVTDGVRNRDGAYRFDPAAQEWRQLRPLPAPARGISAVSIGRDRVLLAGGYTEGFLDDVWIYDTRRDRYERATPLPFGVSGLDLISRDGVILAMGGEDRMRSRSRRFIQGKDE